MYTTKVYPVTVPFRGPETIKNLVTMGDWGYASNVNDAHFPQVKDGNEQVNLHLINAGPRPHTSEARQAIYDCGRVTAGPAELLALCLQYPNLHEDLAELFGEEDHLVLVQLGQDAVRTWHEKWCDGDANYTTYMQLNKSGTRHLHYFWHQARTLEIQEYADILTWTNSVFVAK